MPQGYFERYFAPSAPPLSGGSLFSRYFEAPKTDETFGGLLEPIITPISKVFDILNRPSQAVAAGAQALLRQEDPLQAAKEGLMDTREVSFEDVLGEAGLMEPGLKRTLAGLGLDIVTDPLNLVGGLPFKVASKLVKPLKALKREPTGLVRAAGERFVPHFDLPEPYRSSRRLLEGEIQAGKVEEFEGALKRFKGTSPEERKPLTFALDKPPGEVPLSPRQQTLLGEQQAHFAKLRDEEIAAKVLDPEKVVENYVTYLFSGPAGAGTRRHLVRRLGAKNPFADRDLSSIEQAITVGKATGSPVELDIARIAAIRGAESKRLTATARFFEKAVRDFSLPANAAPPGFREVRIVGELPIRALFVGRAFEPSVAADLEKLMEVGQTRDALDNAFRVATAWWKGYATAANPGFHIRNLASNVFNSWLGGMNLGLALPRHVEAASWMAGIRPSKVGLYPSDVVDEALRKMGIAGAGHGQFGEVASALDELTARTRGSLGKTVQAVNPLSRFNVIQRFGRDVGTKTEDVSRIALFLDRLHKGEDLESAALHVKKYLFDYSELTDFERNIRDYAVPFYTWLRKNIPLQLEHLARTPQKYAHVGKVVEEIEETGEEKGLRVPDTLRPEWLQRLSAVQVPTQTSTGERVFFNPDLAYQDLNLLPLHELVQGEPGEAAAQLGRTALSSLNPLLKIPAELALNREAFTERDIVDPNVGPDQMVKAPDYLAVVANLDSRIAAQIGAKRIVNREGEVEWMVPARVAYLANQLPFFTKLGKVVNTAQPAQQGQLPIDIFGKHPQPRHLGYAGFALQPLSPIDQAKATASRLRSATRKRRAVTRQEALTVPTPDRQAEELLLRLILGGGGGSF